VSDLAGSKTDDGEICLFFDLPKVAWGSGDYWQSYDYLKFPDLCLTSRIASKESWKIPDFSAVLLYYRE
jgi:hypothetical protein